MANKRMFSSAVTESDTFIDMPLSAQALYFHLCLNADDDGMIDCPKKIQRSLGCHDDDMKLLIAKGFLILFYSGIVVIVHWRVHNSIQKDRYKPTAYQNEYSQLVLLDNKMYAMGSGEHSETNRYISVSNTDTPCIQVGYKTDTQDRIDIGKDRSDKIRVDEIKSAPARTFGEFKNILLSDDEYNDLIKEYGEKIITEYIRRMDTYLHNNPKKRYASHYTQLKLWLSEDKVKGITDYKAENAFNVSDPWGA